MLLSRYEPVARYELWPSQRPATLVGDCVLLNERCRLAKRLRQEASVAVGLVGAGLLEEMRCQDIPQIMWAARQQSFDGTFRRTSLPLLLAFLESGMGS